MTDDEALAAPLNRLLALKARHKAARPGVSVEAYLAGLLTATSPPACLGRRESEILVKAAEMDLHPRPGRVG